MNFWYKVRNLVKQRIDPRYNESFELAGRNYPAGCIVCREIREGRIASLVIEGNLRGHKKVEKFNFHTSCLNDLSASVLDES